jgi:hypothetical protein
MTRDARDELVEAVWRQLTGQGRTIWKDDVARFLDALASPEVLPGLVERATQALCDPASREFGAEPEEYMEEAMAALRAALCAPKGRREE